MERLEGLYWRSSKARNHLRQVRRHDTQVIQSGIGAVHDTPCTMMIPRMLKVARETREREPILLLTERNPRKWAARRAQLHGSAPQLAGKDPKGALPPGSSSERAPADPRTPRTSHSLQSTVPWDAQHLYTNLIVKSPILLSVPGSTPHLYTNLIVKSPILRSVPECPIWLVLGHFGAVWLWYICYCKCQCQDMYQQISFTWYKKHVDSTQARTPALHITMMRMHRRIPSLLSCLSYHPVTWLEQSYSN